MYGILRTIEPISRGENHDLSPLSFTYNRQQTKKMTFLDKKVVTHVC